MNELSKITDTGTTQANIGSTRVDNSFSPPQEDWEIIKVYLNKWKDDPESNFTNKEEWFKQVFTDLLKSQEQKVMSRVNDKIMNLMGWEKGKDYDRALQDLKESLELLEK